MTGEIGARIRRLRAARGLSQSDLAGADLSTSYISLIEAGKRIPSPRALELIASRLGCLVDDIYNAAAAEAEAAIDFALAEAEWSLADGDPETALARFSRVRRLALDAERQEHAVRAAWGEARSLERLNRFEEALGRYQDLLGRRPSGGTPSPTRWEIIGALCHCEVELGENDRAIEAGERALNEFRESGAAPSAAGVEIMCELVRAHLGRGDVVRSRQLTAAAIKAAEVLRNPQQLARAYWAAGQTAQEAGRTAEAIRLTRQAVELLTQGDDEAALGEALALHGTALLWDDERNTEQAEADLRRAAEIHERGGRLPAAARCHQELARCSLMRGDGEAALESTAHALFLLDAAPRADRAQALVLTAAALAMRGRKSEAMQRCDDAVAALNADTRRLYRTAAAWGEAAEVYVALGALDKAIDAWRSGFTRLRPLAPVPVTMPFPSIRPV
ncbi:helix-turn-helix domain-containing protein [Streptomyces phaeofaciens]|uniref:helix-turn-helix domain-containing protein n=1 Tax=Streptomyces phaeofaciens TaxID=68254 RepID=UPI00368E736E